MLLDATYMKPIIYDNTTHFPCLVAKNIYVRDEPMRTSCSTLKTFDVT